MMPGHRILNGSGLFVTSARVPESLFSSRDGVNGLQMASRLKKLDLFPTDSLPQAGTAGQMAIVR